MKFSELQQIIEHLINNVKCPNCDHGYEEEQLSIIGATPDEVLFFTNCSGCNTQVLINVALGKEKDETDDLADKLEIQTQLAPSISKDDFLDVKNFLNEFNGDFKKLFSS